MKRALTICTAVTWIGLGVLGADLSGSWSAELGLLPNLELNETTLDLTYTGVSGWEITSTSAFEAVGFTSQAFSFEGTVGPVSVEGDLSFSPIDVTLESVSYVIPDSWSGLGYDLLIQDGLWETVGPSYVGSTLSTTLEFCGIALGLEIEHLVDHEITVDAAGMIGEYLFYLDFPAYIIGTDTWTLQPHPTRNPFVAKASGAPYAKYFVTYERIKLVATKVTFSGVDLAGDPVTHVLTGTFEVYYFDADSGTVTLTFGADMYLWSYISEYGAANGWDLDEQITYTIDIADVDTLFLFPNYMSYTLTAALDPFALEVVFDDVCTGIQFKSALLTLKDMSICCGVTFDAELSFTKCEGFDYLKFTAKDLFPICCGISFDMGITFTVDAKAVTIEPKWEGVLDGCFEIYGDVQEKEEPEFGVEGIEIYGFKLRCDLAECHYVEFLTALCPEKIEEILDQDIFKGDEFEYVKLGFCGPGCCGGEYSVDVAVYFEPTGLFGISRLSADFSIPVMSGFTVDASFSSEPSLSLGWTFTF